MNLLDEICSMFNLVQDIYLYELYSKFSFLYFPFEEEEFQLTTGIHYF